MFTRFGRGLELVRASFAVLQADKELLVFPLVSMIGVLLVTATFAVPMFLSGLVDRVALGGFDFFSVLVAFLFYVVMYTVIFYCNTALIGAALIRLRGGDPTLADGFRMASQRMGGILGYALISATVGMILRALSERQGLIGQIIVSLIGAAWNVITFLVVPVLVVEDLGPVEAIKRSGSLLKETWGEQLSGNFGIGLIFGLIMLAVIAVSVPLFVAAAAAESVVMIVLVIVLLVLVLGGLSLISSAVSGIFSAAVYHYVTTGGEGDNFFGEDLLQGAFARR